MTAFPRTTESRVQLSEDILYIIAEKLIFTKPLQSLDEVDLRVKNAYTMFILHSQLHMNAFFAQLGKMKRIEFAKYSSGERISLYRDKESTMKKKGDEDFGGPYLITRKFIYEMIKRGKMNVSHVRTFNFINGKCKIDHLKEPNNVEIFNALFLQKDKLLQTRSKLVIEKLILNEPVENIKENLEALLLLNAEEIGFWAIERRGNATFDCSSFTNSIVADRTKKIIVTFEEQLTSFPPDLKSFTNFLVKSCPNLTTLEFQIISKFYNPYTISDILHAYILNIINELLKPLEAGNDQLKIRIMVDTRGTIDVYEYLGLEEHQLYKMGSPMNIDYTLEGEKHIGRTVEVTDLMGRKHECMFQIYLEPPDYSDGDYGSDDDPRRITVRMMITITTILTIGPDQIELQKTKHEKRRRMRAIFKKRNARNKTRNKK